MFKFFRIQDSPQMITLLVSGLVAAFFLVIALINLLVYGALVAVSKFHERTRQTKALRSLDEKLQSPPTVESAKGGSRRRLFGRDEFKATDLPRLVAQSVHEALTKPLSAEDTPRIIRHQVGGAIAEFLSD